MHKVIGGVGKRYVNKRVLAPRPRWNTPIPSIWPEVGKSPISGRQPVTLCAVALCRVDPLRQQEVIVGISDRMLTWNDEIEFETENQTKINGFGPMAKAVALSSGTTSISFEAYTETHKVI